MFEEVNILIVDAVSWRVIQNAEGANAGSTRSRYGYSGIETRIRSVPHVWAITESLIFKKIVDYVDLTSVFFVLIGATIPLWNVDSMLAYRETSIERDQFHVWVRFSLGMSLLTEE